MSGAQRHPESERGFGRDGISGLVNPLRAVRAREVSRPSEEDVRAAEEAAKVAIARLGRGRR